jgi:hypothetical protein
MTEEMTFARGFYDTNFRDATLQGHPVILSTIVAREIGRVNPEYLPQRNLA